MEPDSHMDDRRQLHNGCMGKFEDISTLFDIGLTMCKAFSIAQGVLLTLASNTGYGQSLSMVDAESDMALQQEKVGHS